ncbi:MAG TPA: thiamine pyrophosphate-dependent enzyme, partial [Streptosporangiaceae bacterium]|nr:thiamine pyrophosphate-dependent enzyme [Streptosporangiaceae bacterium]
PEMLPAALLGAMRVLTDPAETGAVCVALPQDVQAQAWDWPVSLFAERVWYVPRPVPDPLSVSRAAELIRTASRPLIVAGGGVLYSSACPALASFAGSLGIPVAQTQAGKSTMRWDDPLCVGAIGATGTAAANELARAADVVIGIGTRWTDFTTASRSVFAAPDARFVSVNIAAADASRLPGVAVVGDARAALEELSAALSGWSAPSGYAAQAASLRAAWQDSVTAAYSPASGQAPLRRQDLLRGQDPLPGQAEVIGAVNEAAGDSGIVLAAAGSMPGDLHRLWRTGDPGTYHVEYGYSCMGYEIAGGLGARMAAPDRDVFVLVGDGSYLMMSSELVTAVQEDVKLIVVCVDNHGFASIGNLSESVGAQRFGTSYRARSASGRLDGGVLPIDLAANAASLGVSSVRVRSIAELREALAAAKASAHSTVVVIETDPSVPVPSSEAWWDVPVAEVSTLESTRAARVVYEREKQNQRPLL